MSESEIMRIQREALMKFSKGDRRLVIRIIQEFGHLMREHFRSRSGKTVTSDELCAVLSEATKDWPLSKQN